MAAPIVSGIAALIKSNNPTLNTSQIKAVVCGTVQDNDKNYNVKYDGGIVDAYAALCVDNLDIVNITYSYNYSGSPANFTEYAVLGNYIEETTVIPQISGLPIQKMDYDEAKCK